LSLSLSAKGNAAFQRRQSQVKEILDADQELQLLASELDIDRDRLSEVLHRRQVFRIQHQQVLNQIAIKERQILDPPATPPSEEERLRKIQLNIDHEAKAKVDAMNTTPSYSQYIAQARLDAIEQERVSHLTPREKLLHQAGLLNPDGTTTRPITAHDEKVIAHSLRQPDGKPFGMI
jgi:hypothetical protein